jgi:hypothetical protein
MSAVGHFRRFDYVRAESAFLPLATRQRTCRHVRKVPDPLTLTFRKAEGDILSAISSCKSVPISSLQVHDAGGKAALSAGAVI